MAAEHPLGDRVYHALKTDILDGHLDEARLGIPALQGRYNASATPIREALIRLVGEQLVDIRSSGGFELPHLAPAQIRDLLDLSKRLVLSAFDALPRRSENERSARFDLDDAARAHDLFLAIVTATGNLELVAAFASLAHRMSRIRRAELLMLSNLDRERMTMLNQLRAGNTSMLRRSITNYHRRRIEKAKQLSLHVAMTP